MTAYRSASKRTSKRTSKCIEKSGIPKRLKLSLLLSVGLLLFFKNPLAQACGGAPTRTTTESSVQVQQQALLKLREETQKKRKKIKEGAQNPPNIPASR